MPTPSQPPKKKQKTISSFFTAKPKPPQPATEPPAIHKTPAVPDDEAEQQDDDDDDEPPRSRRRVSQKRALEEEDFQPSDGGDGDEDYYAPPPPKKSRTIGDQQPKQMFLAPPTTPQSTAQASETAKKYRYNASSTECGQKEDGSGMTEKKQRLREQWLKKLGRVDIGRRKDAETDGDEEGEAEEEEEEEPGPITKRFGKGKAAPTTKRKSKLTPLEKQVVDIKRQYPDTVLVVEVGYKFRFFGEDARIASQNLSIMCIPGKMRFDEHPSEAHLDKFASASIPVPRLHVHVKRLVANGYKVGVVRQLETAALKAAGDNRNAPFERKLTNLYTKGTYIDDIDGMEGDISSGAGSGGAPNTGFLLCITEKPGGGTGTDEKSHVGIIAVQPSTGEVIYDGFDDGFMRSEIETRLLHIAPCEFLIVGELTKATEKLVSHLAGSTTTILGDKVRVERVETQKGAMGEASSHVSKFYANKVQFAEESESSDKNKLLDTVLDLPPLVTLCLSAMIKHLSDYGLEHVLDLTKYFQPFSARSHMLLNGNTLSSLEIYRNQTDYTTKGSLFWTLDRTKTNFGRRLLRKWVGRPLLDKAGLEERFKAVEEIRAGDNQKLDKLRTLLSKISYDLEKGLIRIYYGKCTRPELLSVLQTMHRISVAFEPVEEAEDVGFQSSIINNCIAALPGIREHVSKYLDVFDHQAAGRDDKYDFFKENDEYEAISDHKLGIAAVEADLQSHNKEIATQLKKKTATYITVSGIDYLVEVSNDKASLKNVPASWVKISGTKKVSRFHTPKVISMLREREQRKESLAAECDRAFKEFLTKISTQYQLLRDTVQSLAVLDCLCSLAAVSLQQNYVKPTFVDTPTIEITAGRHPMVEQLLLDSYVPNDVRLTANERRAMLITGPNMGGKSSFVRQVALISIMAQIGSYVPAESATLGLLDAVFTRMGAFDNMMAGESTFMVELSETSDILKMATPRSLIILDELGRGTSTHDGVAIAHAVFDYVIQDLKSLLLFVTHYPLLARFGDVYPEHVINTHMAFHESGNEEVTFLYRVAEGVAHRSYGLNVARLAGLPNGVIDRAGEKSRWLEGEMSEREALRWGRCALDPENADVETLLGSLENLAV